MKKRQKASKTLVNKKQKLSSKASGKEKVFYNFSYSSKVSCSLAHLGSRILTSKILNSRKLTPNLRAAIKARGNLALIGR